MNNAFFKFRIVLFSFVTCFNTVIGQIDESPAEIRAEKAIQEAGDVIHIGLPVIAGLATLLEGDKKGRWQFVKSFGFNLATTYALKFAINKDRPEGATDGLAFPSGHTSVAFHSASFIYERYGWEYGIPAYALAGFVAYSRLEGLNDRHDGWDVLGGILVGVCSTYLFASPYMKDHFKLTFNSQNGQFLVGVNYKF